MANLKIGLLTSSYPRSRADPAGAFVAGMARWLARSGAAVEVLAPQGAGQGGGPTEVPVHVVRYAHKPVLFYGDGAPDNLIHSWRARAQVPAFLAALALETWRRSVPWTHLLSHWLLPCGVVAASGAGRALPHLAVAHSSDVHLLARLPGAPVLLHALARPRTRLLCTCLAIQDKLRLLCRTGRSRALVDGAEVMRMGMDPSPSRREAGGRSRAVLYLGRLVPVKGVDLLLEAVKALDAEEPGIELWVAGEGLARPTLERGALALGIKATFFGQVAGAQKADLLARAGVLALPSRVMPDGRTDAAPVVLLEAMAAGLPVVATRVGGNAELITHGQDGLLVPPEDPRALAQALVRAMQEPGLSRAGLERARQHTWERLTPRLLSMLARI